MKNSLLKLFIIFIYSILFSKKTYAQTQLDSLWNLCILKNENIKISEIQKINAELNQKYSSYIYAPNFKIYGGGEFTDMYEEITSFPDATETYISGNFSIPGGGNISAVIEYDMNRYIMNLYKQPEYENLGYSQTSSVTLSYNQSLMPFYFLGCKEDPIKINYKNQNEAARISYDYNKYSNISQVTTAYINLRRNCRQLKLTEDSISLLEFITEYLEENKTNGYSTLADIWEYENKKVEYTSNLINYLEQQENLLSELKSLCGNITISDNYFTKILEEPLPELIVNPEKYDFSLKQYELQKNNAFAQKISDYQNYAPRLGLQGKVSYELPPASHNDYWEQWKEKGTFAWVAGIYIEFSPENMIMLNRNKKLYKNNEEILAKQEEIYITNKLKTIDIYDKMILYLNDVLEKSLKAQENKRNYAETIKIQFERGISTEVELKQAELTYKESCVISENYKDMVWYYTWLKNQIVE